MKTTNLTPWCNLFSTALKYNITLRKSRYQLVLGVGCAVTLVILPLIFVTYAYQLGLAIAIIFVFLSAIWLAHTKKHQQNIISRFELNNEGVCSFETSMHRIEHYQLLENSRFSFFGCWLFLQPTTNNSCVKAGGNLVNNSDVKKQFFIYRDSLSDQDYSRLTNVIAQLNHSR